MAFKFLLAAALAAATPALAKVTAKAPARPGTKMSLSRRHGVPATQRTSVNDRNANDEGEKHLRSVLESLGSHRYPATNTAVAKRGSTKKFKQVSSSQVMSKKLMEAAKKVAQRAKRSLTKELPEGLGSIPSMDGVGDHNENGHPVAHYKNENYYWYIRRDPFDPQWVRNVWAIAFWAFVGDMSLQVEKIH